MPCGKKTSKRKLKRKKSISKLEKYLTKDRRQAKKMRPPVEKVRY